MQSPNHWTARFIVKINIFIEKKNKKEKEAEFKSLVCVSLLIMV